MLNGEVKRTYLKIEDQKKLEIKILDTFTKNVNKSKSFFKWRFVEKPKRGLLAWAEEDYSKINEKLKTNIVSKPIEDSTKIWKHDKFESKRDMDVDIY